MAKKKSQQIGDSSSTPKTLDEKIAALELKFGVGAATYKTSKIVNTGSHYLNMAMGTGGYPVGKLIEIYGPESCLDGETFIQYDIRTKGGRRQNTKGGTIKRLYERFNGIERKGQGYYQRENSLNCDFYASSINEYGRIFKNKIENVVYTGKQVCYEITTLNGHKIIATNEHKFFDGDKYIPLRDLKTGDIITIHNGTHFKVENYEKPKNRSYLFVKEHPIAGTKTIDKYIYKRVARSRAVYEAFLNKLSFEEYVERLNIGDIEGLVFLERNDHIHHIDEDCTNDSLSNLFLISSSEHSKLHSIDRHNNLRFVIVPDEVISVVYIGVRDTYDIRMASPFNNYIANNFVVHNSGKSTIVLHAIAEFQKTFPEKRVALFDFEHSYDKEYAATIGVDDDALKKYQPDYQEQGYNLLENLVQEGLISLAVLDSQTAAIPREIIEGNVDDATMALQARNNSKFFGKIKGKLDKHDVLLLVVSQTRSNIGGMQSGTTIPTGGNALKFYADIRFKIWKELDKPNELNKTTVDVIKNKCASPFGQACFDIVWGIGIDSHGEILDMAIEKGLVKKSGAWYKLNDAVETVLGCGRDAVKDLFRDNPEMFEELKTKVFSNEISKAQ